MTRWQQDEAANADGARRSRCATPRGRRTRRQARAAHKGGVLFRAPRKLDYMKLVPLELDARQRRRRVEARRRPSLRRREGFALTDPGTDLAGALDQAHYCIWCHEQGKDSCAHGLLEKKPAGGAAARRIRSRRAPFGVTLAGCPLEEKISEFHKLRAEGWPLGALAIICVDNPMVAATGHRICNDCMKSCIYQKQDPVDIPQAETRTLKDVLALPWGFEIYSLLTRWNPLNLRRPLPRARDRQARAGRRHGPGGLHARASPAERRPHGRRHRRPQDRAARRRAVGRRARPASACRSSRYATSRSLNEPLDDRVMAGFGGVAEYGITVRWDKNFLKIIRLLLERRDAFALFGGVRFGGTLDADGAFALGFDHVALAAGAGRPTVLDLPNGLAQRRAHRVRLPDGAAAHRRGEDAIRSPTCRCGCRSSWSAAA